MEEGKSTKCEVYYVRIRWDPGTIAFTVCYIVDANERIERDRVKSTYIPRYVGR